MMEMHCRFEKGQFVQEISFKHDGLPRQDLGIEKFGFINSHAIIARNYHEYIIVFANCARDEERFPTLEYCLRAVTDEEVRKNLDYIAKNQENFQHFIVMLNNTEDLSSYHIPESEVIKSYRESLSNIELTVDPLINIPLLVEETEEAPQCVLTTI